MRTEGSKTCFPFHPGKHSGPEDALVLPLPALAPVGLELGFASLSPLVLVLQRLPIYFASLPPPPPARKSPRVTCQTPRTQGVFCDSQGAIALHSHPSSFSGLSRDHCLFTSGRVFWWFFFPQVSQWALLKPWKPHQPSQGLSKTSSVCPLLSQAIKVWSCLPEL